MIHLMVKTSCSPGSNGKVTPARRTEVRTQVLTDWVTTRGKGHHQSTGTKNDSKKKKQFKCYNCGGRGHFSKECKQRKKNKEEKAMLAQKQNEQLELLFSEAYMNTCDSTKVSERVSQRRRSEIQAGIRIR